MLVLTSLPFLGHYTDSRSLLWCSTVVFCMSMPHISRGYHRPLRAHFADRWRLSEDDRRDCKCLQTRQERKEPTDLKRMESGEIPGHYGFLHGYTSVIELKTGLNKLQVLMPNTVLNVVIVPTSPKQFQEFPDSHVYVYGYNITLMT